MGAAAWDAGAAAWDAGAAASAAGPGRVAGTAPPGPGTVRDAGPAVPVAGAAADAGVDAPPSGRADRAGWSNRADITAQRGPSQAAARPAAITATAPSSAAARHGPLASTTRLAWPIAGSPPPDGTPPLIAEFPPGSEPAKPPAAACPDAAASTVASDMG